MKRYGYRYILIVIIIAGASIFLAYNEMSRTKKAAESIVYLPLGDSYTIGIGAEYENNFPNQLVKRLAEAEITLVIPENPARGGSTTFDVISDQLPVLDNVSPQFVTILVGVNDLIRGIDTSTYKKNLETIINTVQAKMGDNKKNILLITLPDFSLTPAGRRFGNEEEVSKGLEEFNEVIMKTADKFGLRVADIYPVSKNVVSDTTLTAEDGLHPSAKGYAEWVKVIAPVAEEISEK